MCNKPVSLGYPVEKVNARCESFIAGFDYASSGRTLIYADPPYVQATRGKDRYRFDYTDDDHRELVGLLRRVPAHVMISGYPSKLYDELLGDWRCVTFQAMTRGGPRTEAVWMNFSATSTRVISDYAGLGFTDRQRIKRKAERWAAKWRALPQPEREAILARMLGDRC